MEDLVRQWIESPANKYGISLTASSEAAPAGLECLCLAREVTGPCYLLLFEGCTGSTKRLRVRDLIDLASKESLQDLIVDLAPAEVMEIVNSLLESVTEEESAASSSSTAPSLFPAGIQGWQVLEQRAKSSRLPFNRRILNDFSGVLKSIEQAKEDCYSFDLTTFTECLSFSNGLAYTFNEGEFALPVTGVEFCLGFNQKNADRDARLLQKDLERLGLPGIDIAISFPENYPFSPPRVRVVRPRIRENTGYVIEGSICMQLLDAAGWSPAYTLSGVLLSVHAMLLSGRARLAIPEAGQSAEAYLAEGRNEKRKRAALSNEKWLLQAQEALARFRARKTKEIKFAETTFCSGCAAAVKCAGAGDAVAGAGAASASASASASAAVAKETAAPTGSTKCARCLAPYCSSACSEADQNHRYTCGFDKRLSHHTLPDNPDAAPAAVVAMDTSSTSLPPPVPELPAVAQARAQAHLLSFCDVQGQLLVSQYNAALDGGSGGSVGPQLSLEDLHRECIKGYTSQEAQRASEHIQRVHKSDGWKGAKLKG